MNKTKEDFYYIGYDFGKRGAVAVLKNGLPFFRCAMPVVGKEIDIKKILSILQTISKKEGRHHLILENSAGAYGLGKKQAVSMAEQAGICKTACIALGIPYTAITARKWQNAMFKDTKLVYKTVDGKKKLDTKKTALILAQKLFPRESFLATKRSKVPHDGIVDALILAEYGRRRNL